MTWRLRPAAGAVPPWRPSPLLVPGATGRPEAVREGGGTAPPREASAEDAGEGDARPAAWWADLSGGYRLP